MIVLITSVWAKFRLVCALGRCKSEFYRSDLRCVGYGLAVVLLLLFPACATKPRWTPESVAPPTAPPSGLELAAPLAQHAQPLEFPAKAEEANVVKLSRDGAILTALKNNRSIEVARFGPQIGVTFVPEARSAFDPVLLSTISTGRDTHQLTATAAAVNPSASLTAFGTVATTASALRAQMQRLAASNPVLASATKAEVSDTQGTAGIQEFLPTGTQIFLTGGTSGAETKALGTSHDYQGEWTLGVNQALLRGASPSANLVALRQARNRAAQSQYAFRDAVLNVVEQVDEAYWSFVLAKEVVKIREFALKLADEQLKHNQEWFQVGKVIEGDVMASKAEKSSRMADLTDAQAAVQSQTMALINLLNPQTDQRWQVSFDPVDPPEVIAIPVVPESSEKLALQYRPELAQARLDVGTADMSVTKARDDLLPSINLTGQYGLTSRGPSNRDATKSLADGEYDNYRVGIALQTPILYRGERARLQRAKLSAAQAGKAVETLELAIATEVRQAAVETDKQMKRLTATQEAVASRTEQLRIAEGRNAVGKTTTLDLMIVQRDFIQAQIDEVTARVKYIQSLTSLYGSEGTLLERRGVSLDNGAKKDQLKK